MVVWLLNRSSKSFRASRISALVGLCSFAPNALPRHGLALRGGKLGTYKVYLDNLRIRRADGSHTPIWTGGKDTRYRPIADSELFTGIRVRTVPADQVK